MRAPLKRLERLVVIPTLVLSWLAFSSACTPDPTPDDGDDPTCETYDDEVFALTANPASDEDGGFILGSDGTLHFVFISDRSGNIDTWITSSSDDGMTWSSPVAVAQTPDDELFNNVTVTRDGEVYLVGRRQYSTWGVRALDDELTSFSDPIRWTDPAYFASGQLQDQPDGTYWLMFVTNQNGTWDLFLQSSDDQGESWSAPVAVVDSPREDFVFSFRITDDGTFLLLWVSYDSDDPAAYTGNSADIYLATSSDGASWSTSQLLTPDPGSPVVDTLPWILDAPDGSLFAVWLTARYPSIAPVAVVGAPLYPTPQLDDLRAVPAEGYSVRSQTLPNGRSILAWVATSDDGSYDYYYRYVCDFDFDSVTP